MNENDRDKAGKKEKKSSRVITALPHVNKKITEIVYNRKMFLPVKTQGSIIAFVSGKIGSAFIPTVTRGVEERIRELGRAKSSLIFQSPRNGSPKEAGNEIMNILKEKSANGIIVLSITPERDVIDSAVKSSVPVVLVERQIPGLHSVKVNNFKGGFMAAEHLIKKGRSKPGVIIDAQTADTESAAHERFLGFKAGLKTGGIQLSTENIVKAEYHSIEAGRISFEKLGKKIKKIDSIFSVAGDTVAIGFMIEAKSQGIKIPRDLAVIGFDDMDVASAVEPALTTVRQPIEGMGIEAVNIIDEALKGRLKSPKNVILDAELVIRESV